jgi:flagellar biosynthetic protein FliP
MDELPGYFAGIAGILLLTSFVKILTTLSIVRLGIGMDGAGFGLAIIVAAFSLSLLTLSPRLETVGGVNALLSGDLAGKVNFERDFGPFVRDQADADMTRRLAEIRRKAHATEDLEQEAFEVSFGVEVASFMITQLKEAFKLGFVILIPFLIIDLLVVNLFMVLNIVQISARAVTFPLKILAFFVVDGWLLITERLIGG